MVGAASVGSGGAVSEVATGTSFGTWVLGMSLDLASDPRSFGHPDLDESEFVLSVVGV